MKDEAPRPGVRPLEGLLGAAVVALALTAWVASVREQLSEVAAPSASDPLQGLPALLEAGRGHAVAGFMLAVALASLAACAHLLGRAARALRFALADRPLTMGGALDVARAWWRERTAVFETRLTIGHFLLAFGATQLLPQVAVVLLVPRPLPGQRPDPALVVPALVAGQALAVVVLLAFVARVAGRDGLERLGLTTRGLRHEALRGARAWLAVLPFYVVVVAVWSKVGEALGLPVQSHDLIETLAREGPRLALLVFVLAAGLAPVLEEVVYRGLLVPAYARVLGVTGGVLLAALTFGAVHPGFLSLLPITTMGLVFTALYVTSPNRSLVGSIVAHALFNGSQVLIVIGVQLA